MSKKLFKISEKRLKLLLDRENLFLAIIFGLRDLDIEYDIFSALKNNQIFKNCLDNYCDNINNYVL